MSKKIFPNGFKNSGLFTFGKGLILNATGIGPGARVLDGVVGAVKGIKGGLEAVSDKNTEAEAGGKGNVDFFGYIGVGIGLIVLIFTVYQLITGQIDINQFIEINESVN
jgi:hypothetical protein